jgi:hypothetical protein
MAKIQTVDFYKLQLIPRNASKTSTFLRLWFAKGCLVLAIPGSMQAGPRFQKKLEYVLCANPSKISRQQNYFVSL